MKAELIFIAIGMMLVTFIPRLIPMLFMKDIKLPKKLNRFLSFIPYAILGALIFPSVFESSENLLTVILTIVICFIIAYIGLNPTFVVIISIVSIYFFNIIF